MLSTRTITHIAIGFLAFASCTKNDGRVKVYPVHGKVLVRGTPADGARVVFYPVSEDLKKPGMPLPAADADPQGFFKLTSYALNDGAPEGEFRVGVIWPEALPPNASPDKVSTKDRLNGRFADPQKSQLTAKVEKGGGEIPALELQ